MHALKHKAVIKLQSVVKSYKDDSKVHRRAMHALPPA